jgi:hypothetical protein
MRIALLAQLATTLPLVGLIWMVQVVAYPLFARAGAAGFPGYHAAHSAWIGLVVGPLMVGELLAAGLFLLERPAFVPGWLPWAGVTLVLAAWATTAFVSVPMHGVLARGFDAHAHAVLVSTNWIRTAAWTARGAMLLWATGRALAP